jgi:bacteriocin-like protein
MKTYSGDAPAFRTLSAEELASVEGGSLLSWLRAIAHALYCLFGGC